MKKYLVFGMLTVAMFLGGVSVADAYTWTNHGGSSGIKNWNAIAVDSTGTKVFVASNLSTGGRIYASSDSGATWSLTSAPADDWNALATNATGTIIYAANIIVRKSIDGGATWTATSPRPLPCAVHSLVTNSTGSTVFVACNGGIIHKSTNGGVTWSTVSHAMGAAWWQGITLDSTGMKIVVAGMSATDLYRSTNGGLSWTALPSPSSADTTALAGDASGTKLFLLKNTGALYESINAGATWTLSPGSPSGTWRDIGTNASGTKLYIDVAGGHVWTTTSPSTVTLPTVVTNPATGMTMTSAFFHGTLTNMGGATSTAVSFEYGLTPSYGSIMGSGVTPNPMTATGTFSAGPAFFTCDTPYYYRARATNSAGTAFGGMQTFRTLPCSPGIPTVTTLAATITGPGTATINGRVNTTGGATVTATGFTGSFGLPITTPASITTVPTTFSSNLTGLTCGLTYTFTANATNSAGTGSGGSLSFTMPICPPGVPTVTTDFVTPASITASFAILNGTLTNTGGGVPVSEGFEYGTTPSYGSSYTVASTSVVGSFNGGPSTPLICNTLYYYRAFATNSAGTTYGIDRTFTTLPCPPTVITTTAIPVGSSTATLNGAITVTGGANATIVGFNWGTTTTVAGTSGAFVSTTVGGPFGVGPFSLPVSGLACLTTYHYRAWATNSAGTSYGSDLTFTTLPCPPVPPTVTITSATYSGTTATLVGKVLTLGAPTTGIPSTSLLTTVGFMTGSTAIPAPSISTNGATFTATYPSLSCSTPYSFTATASNTNGSATSTPLGFTTGGCTPVIPTVAISATYSTSTSSFTLTGTLVSLGSGSSGLPSTTLPTTVGLWNSLASIPTTPSSVTTNGATFTATYPAPCGGGAYNFRATGTNVNGTAVPATTTMTTPSCVSTISPPSVFTDLATGVSSSGATLNGHLASAGGATTGVSFTYATDAAYISSGGFYTTSVTATPSTITASPPSVSFSRSLSGLACGLYHYEAVASNSGYVRDGLDQTFTIPCTPGAQPTVTISATYSGSTATITGTLASLGTPVGGSPSTSLSTSVSLRRGTTSLTTTPATVTTNGSTFTATYSPVSCSNSYVFSAHATNSNGVATPASTTLSIPPCSVVSPAMTTNTPTISGASVTLSGQLATMGTTSTGASGGPVTTGAGFEYGPFPGGYPTVVNIPGTYSFSVGSPFTSTVTTIPCGVPYHYRSRGTNLAGSAVGNEQRFTIPCPSTPPSVITTTVGTTTQTTAVINGQVTSMGTATSVTPGFNIPLGTTLGAVTPSTITGTVSSTFWALLSGLSCNTTYTYTANVTATSTGTTVAPSGVTFTTQSCSPNVATTSGSVVSSTAIGSTVNLVGNLLSLGFGSGSATVGFYYGPTATLPSGVGSTSVTVGPRSTTGSYNTNVFASPMVTCNEPWHVRAWATNAGGTVTGADVSFCN